LTEAAKMLTQNDILAGSKLLILDVLLDNKFQ